MDVFEQFERDCRQIPNWVGAVARRDFFTPDLTYVSVARPHEDVVEWEAVLRSVMGARTRFVMLELGAGYGRWTVNAVQILRAYSGLPYRVIAVEAEPTHYAWLRQHARDNGLRRRWTRLLQAAVTRERGRKRFYSGDPAGWWGQALVDVAGEGLPHPVVTVPTVTLSSLLHRHASVDFIHLDAQGVELDVLEEAWPLFSRVGRVYVETHTVEIDSGVHDLFARDWVLEARELFGERETGGAQVWAATRTSHVSS